MRIGSLSRSATSATWRKLFVHHAVQALVYFFLVPVHALDVLYPLEVGDDDAAGAGQDVGDDEGAGVVQDLVGLRRDGPVGGLEDDARLHVGSVLLRDLALEGAGHENVHGQGEQLGVGDDVADAALRDTTAPALEAG